MTRQDLANELRSMADRIESKRSCGNSCIVAKARGMATNGGCHCLPMYDWHRYMQRIRDAERKEAKDNE